MPIVIVVFVVSCVYFTILEAKTEEALRKSGKKRKKSRSIFR